MSGNLYSDTADLSSFLHVSVQFLNDPVIGSLNVVVRLICNDTSRLKKIHFYRKTKNSFYTSLAVS